MMRERVHGDTSHPRVAGVPSYASTQEDGSVQYWKRDTFRRPAPREFGARRVRMTISGQEGARQAATATKPIANDVVITVATSNGTGSQSANLILMRSIFQMGVPVSGKNMFPSNIQGLPTWFTVRANDDGWV